MAVGMAIGVPHGAGAASAGAAASSKARGQRLEILVHNISHKDMVLSLRRTRTAAKPLPQQPAGKAISNVIDAVRIAATPIRVLNDSLLVLGPPRSNVCIYTHAQRSTTHSNVVVNCVDDWAIQTAAVGSQRILQNKGHPDSCYGCLFGK